MHHNRPCWPVCPLQACTCTVLGYLQSGGPLHKIQGMLWDDILPFWLTTDRGCAVNISPDKPVCGKHFKSGPLHLWQ